MEHRWTYKLLMLSAIALLLYSRPDKVVPAEMPPQPEFHMEDFGAPCTLVTDIEEGTCELNVSNEPRQRRGSLLVRHSK